MLLLHDQYLVPIGGDGSIVKDTLIFWGCGALSIFAASLPAMPSSSSLNGCFTSNPQQLEEKWLC